MWLLVCEVASGLDATWRYRYEALAPMLPANTDKAVECLGAAGTKMLHPEARSFVPPGQALVWTTCQSTAS